MIGMGRPWPSLKSKETTAEENDKTKTVKTPILDKEARKSGEKDTLTNESIIEKTYSSGNLI